MKELLEQYAGYNVWATETLSVVILGLTPEQQDATVASSFNSITKTILHQWDAENIWWQRMNKAEKVIPPSASFTGNCEEAAAGLLAQSIQWENKVKAMSEEAMKDVFAYYNKKMEHHVSPVFQVLLHVFNHGTYHRGQLVTMMRQLGQTELPSTDFTTYTWVKK